MISDRFNKKYLNFWKKTKKPVEMFFFKKRTKA